MLWFDESERERPRVLVVIGPAAQKLPGTFCRIILMPIQSLHRTIHASRCNQEIRVIRNRILLYIAVCQVCKLELELIEKQLSTVM